MQLAFHAWQPACQLDHVQLAGMLFCCCRHAAGTQRSQSGHGLTEYGSIFTFIRQLEIEHSAVTCWTEGSQACASACAHVARRNMQSGLLGSAALLRGRPQGVQCAMCLLVRGAAGQERVLCPTKAGPGRQELLPARSGALHPHPAAACKHESAAGTTLCLFYICLMSTLQCLATKRTCCFVNEGPQLDALSALTGDSTCTCKHCTCSHGLESTIR